MAISESQLETWSGQGAVTTFASTYATIKTALRDIMAPYNGKAYDIFLQGSYGNDTNIYADSDVDVVVRLSSTYYYDTSDLPPDQLSLFELLHRPPVILFQTLKGMYFPSLISSFLGR